MRISDVAAPLWASPRSLPRPYAVVGVLAAIVVGWTYLTSGGYQLIGETSAQASPVWFAVLLNPVWALATPFVVWLGFRRPLLATALMCVPLVPSLIDPGAGLVHFGVIAGLAAVALTASWRHPRAAIGCAGLGLAIALAWVAFGTAMAAPAGATIELVYTSRVSTGIGYLVAFAIIAGGTLLLRTSEQRRTLLAREGQVTQQQAVVAERARLARDLHDVVAHHVSLIAVRAETAPYTDPTIDPAARLVLAEVASEARLALDELRGVLGILGRSDDTARAPQPGLADVVDLVERAERSGQQVGLTGDIAAALDAGVTAPVGYAAYRVVQEGLTNARRHAADAPVTVEVLAADALLEITVANPLAHGAAPTALTAGRGLAGMRERVEALGGWLVVDAAGRRFVVRASMPIGSRR